jgi:hypothetical protein
MKWHLHMCASGRRGEIDAVAGAAWGTAAGRLDN